jgi:hypothetical protein
MRFIKARKEILNPYKISGSQLNFSDEGLIYRLQGAILIGGLRRRGIIKVSRYQYRYYLVLHKTSDSRYYAVLAELYTALLQSKRKSADYYSLVVHPCF